MKRIISISICMVFLLSASTILLAPEKTEERMTFEQFIEKVERIIEHRNEQLDRHFSEGRYELMPRLLKDYNTRIVTHVGDVIEGSASENYWRNVGDRIENPQERRLSFDRTHFHAWQLEVSPGARDAEINYAALEITKFSFEVDETTYEGYIDPSYRHRVRCTIED